MTAAVAPVPSTPRAANRRVRWREVALFSVLAYAFTWGWYGLKIWPQLGELLTAPKSPTDPLPLLGHPLYHLVAMFGPLLAAVIMRLVVSREGLRGSLGLRRPWRLYGAAAFVPMAFMVTIGVIIVVLGLAQLVAPSEPFTALTPLLLTLILGLEVFVAFGEEYGWRGYLLPRLLPLGEIKASIIVGLIWSFWHLPALLIGLLYGGQNPWLALAVFCFSTTMVTFAYTWLAVASHNSSTLASLFHGSTNWSANRLLTFLRVDNLVTVNVVMGLAWFAIVAVVYGVRKRSSLVPLSDTVPREPLPAHLS